MSIRFTRKTVAMMLMVLIGLDVAVVGHYHDSSLVLGLGLAIMGAGFLWRGLSAIHPRPAIGHREPRSMSDRRSGDSRTLWGMLLLATGLGLIVVGVAIALA
jgi:hypothetical protein